jgi:hypothetical protein
LSQRKECDFHREASSGQACRAEVICAKQVVEFRPGVGAVREKDEVAEGIRFANDFEFSKCAIA